MKNKFAIFIFLIMLTFFWSFEKRRTSTKEISLISTMATLAAISRIPFAVLMSVQPTTFIVMITGYVFGPQIGFMVGAVAALVSNFFLGQGPWTPWQMFSWGICGILAAMLGMGRDGFKLKQFVVLSFICGYIFGWIMNIWHWASFIYPLTFRTFIATYISSMPFDTLHAFGNVIFSLLFGKSFYYVLIRFKRRMY
ncbi:ECF transporter S component [Caloranaerobacter azorensis]|uniref:ECF transporter S component n=1 Tax=Caloranaerobacter azorensis TaxID=116090 RepID=UPI00068DB2EE|nr:ECF transporter S component [Caloranaerobacter azorensis]